MIAPTEIVAARTYAAEIRDALRDASRVHWWCVLPFQDALRVWQAAAGTFGAVVPALCDFTGRESIAEAQEIARVARALPDVIDDLEGQSSDWGYAPVNVYSTKGGWEARFGSGRSWAALRPLFPGERAVVEVGGPEEAAASIRDRVEAAQAAGAGAGRWAPADPKEEQ